MLTDTGEIVACHDELRFGRSKEGSLFSLHGEAIVYAKKNFQFQYENCSIQVSKGSIFHLVSVGSTLKVRLLSDNANESVRFNINGQNISLNLGQEMILEKSRSNLLLQLNDGLATQNTRVFSNGDHAICSLAEYSFISLMCESDFLKLVFHGTSQLSNRLKNKILKCQAAMSQLRVQRKPYRKITEKSKVMPSGA